MAASLLLSLIGSPVRLFLTAAALPVVALACGGETTPPSILPEPSTAYDLWQPSVDDTCSTSIHNRYSVVGLDGKLYPTWHPPIDSATGCSFGHEHGRDPRGSNLLDEFGPLAFGYANEQLLMHDPGGARPEDHVGHKVEWENDLQMIGDAAGSAMGVRCDVLAKLHQGSHSGDAFASNLHELFYAIRCTDGSQMGLSLLTAIGTPGEFVASCDGRVIVAGDALPANSPKGAGQRLIPDRQCVERFMLVPPGEGSNVHTALHESWEVMAQIQTGGDRLLASVDAYFQVFRPSRFFDPARRGQVGRTASVCTEVLAGGRRASGSECSNSTNWESPATVAFDGPHSLFNGVKRALDLNGNRIENADGPEIWYTDAFGGNARREPFPGSIRQFIASVDNSDRVLRAPRIGRDRDYGGPGVRAPN